MEHSTLEASTVKDLLTGTLKNEHTHSKIICMKYMDLETKKVQTELFAAYWSNRY